MSKENNKKNWIDSFKKVNTTNSEAVSDNNGKKTEEEIKKTADDVQAEPLIDLEKENADFRLTQSLFQKATFDFVCNCQHLGVLLRYFVNVFCHSKLTENAKVIVNLIRDRMETGHNREYVLRYFISHVDAVVGDIANCVIGEALVIVESMITLIDLCFKDTTLADTSKNLCSLILKQIADLSDDCVHIKYFLMILRSFWQKYPSSQRELSEEWADGLMDFVEKAYGPERRPTYYQTIDLSVAFEILTVAVKNGFQMNAELLVRRSDRFVLSPHHIREFLILFVMLVRTNLIDVDSIIPLLNKITDENTLCDLMMFVISDCGKGDTITMINTMEQELPHFNTELLIKSLAVRCEDDSGYTLSQRVIEYTPDVMDHYLLASTSKIRLQCENLFKSLFPHYAAVPDMFCNSSSNCVRKKLGEFVPALAERLDCFVKLHLESSPCPGIVHNNEVIAKNPTIPQANQFTMCSVLRIWHFVCKGAELLTKDRFDLLLELIAITTKVDVWPNYQLICLLNFMLDFPSELVNSVALNQFTTIFQPVLDQEMCCQRFAPVLVCFVSRLDAIDENVASDILSSEQCNELVNQLLFENSNVPELRPIISRVAQCSKPRQKLIEALTNADDWLLTSMLRYWQMLNEAKPLTPKELTGVVNKCLSMFTHPRVTTQTTLEKENCETLKQYVSMVSDVSGPSDDEFWTDDLEIDWQSVLKALRNRPELEPNPVQLLMWCCEHNEVFASEFLENCDLILQHSDNLDIQKAMFKTFVSTATTNQSADSLVCLLKRLLAPLVENVALVSGNTELVLAAKYIRHYVEPNDDWVEPLFTYLISKPHIKVLQDLHESLITRLDVDGVWSIYDDLFTRIADTLKAGEPVPLELSRVFARLWTAKPGLRKQIVEKLGITSDNIALLNTCPGLVCELPDDVS